MPVGKMAFCRKPNKKTNGKKAELSASFSGSAPHSVNLQTK
jgi:hypothetical protein